MKMPKLGPISHFLSPVSCDSLVFTKFQVWMGSRCVKCGVIALTLSYWSLEVQRLNRTGSTQNRPCHGRPKKLSAHAQRHIQRLNLGNRHMSAASIVVEVEGVGGQPVSAQTIRHTLHQFGLHGCCPGRKPLLKKMHKKARKQFAED